MEPMAYVKARKVVALYNKYRCAREVARELKLPYKDCFDLVDWFWNRTFATHEDLIRRMPGNQAVMPELQKPTWIEYLYTRNCTAEAVATSVGWPVTAVLRTCRGPSQWSRTKNRQPLGRAKPAPADNDSGEDEISEDEIYRLAAELRAARPGSEREEKPERVEIQRFSFPPQS